MIRLGIIEDDEIILASLVGYLSQEVGFEVMLSGTSLESFMSDWQDHQYFDIIASDIG